MSGMSTWAVIGSPFIILLRPIITATQPIPGILGIYPAGNAARYISIRLAWRSADASTYCISVFIAECIGISSVRVA